MSRAYRLKVREALKKVIRGSDGVSARLELLNVLPPDQMADLLRQELLGRGFVDKGDKVVRVDADVAVTVDPAAGMVTVEASDCDKVQLEGEMDGWTYDDNGPAARKVREVLRQTLVGRLEDQAKAKEAELQAEVSKKLEGRLLDLKQDLDQAVNRVTAVALKRKAAQLGQIKQISEDPAAGSLTIVVEV